MRVRERVRLQFSFRSEIFNEIVPFSRLKMNSRRSNHAIKRVRGYVEHL